MISNAVLRVVTIANLRLCVVIDKSLGNFSLLMFSVEGIGRLPDFNSDTASIVDLTGIASTAICRKLTIDQQTYICNGWDANKILTGNTIREAGADAAPAPTIGVGGAGSLTGSYTAVYTYFDSANNYETSPTSAASTLITLTSQTLNVSVVASSNARFDKIKIYRNANGVPATYLFDQTVSNATATIVSSQADSLLGTEAQFTNSRPPPVKYVAKTATRVFWGGSKPFTDGTVSVTSGSTTITFTVAPPQNMKTVNAEAPFYFQIVGGPQYVISNLSGTTGTLSTPYAGTTNPSASYIIVGLRTRVYFSDISSTNIAKIESWDPSNFFDLGLAGDTLGWDIQEEMTALIEYGNRIYAFLVKSIWYFDPQLTQRKRTGAACGTISDKTICVDRDGNLVFCGSDMQVYAFNGVATVLLSNEVRNLFAEKSRYNTDLQEYAFARYDAKEGLYELHRPAAIATLDAMRYVVDCYDDMTGKWLERVAPRITAATNVRDNTRWVNLGIDSLGLVQVIDDYETSSTFVDDRFTSVTPTILTSVAGEISPGSNKKGKVAVVFTPTSVKGSKLIVGTQSSSAQTEDLFDPVTVSAGDLYLIGGWASKYETGWWDGGDPESYKIFYFLEGTFIAGSSGYLYITWYVDESQTAIDTVRVTAASNRKFKMHIPARGREIKFLLQGVSELVGFGLRDLTISFKPVGDV